MKILLIMSLAILLITSCDKGGEPNNQTPGSGERIGEIEAPVQRNFTTAELGIARRICGALKYKREKMETLSNMTEQFRMIGEIKNCNTPMSSSAQFSVAISNANSAQLEYEALTTRSSYFKDVVTDRTGVMGTMCDSINTSDTVGNQVLSGSSYLRVNFLIRDSYDTIEISKFTRDGNGYYPMVSTEGISVITTSRPQVDPRYYGIEMVRTRNLKCAVRATDTSFTKQTWVRAETAY